MAYVVTRPARIGDRIREPGEVLSAELLRGRNVRVMEDVERVIRFDPTVPEPVDEEDAVTAADSDGGEPDRKQSRGRGRKATTEDAVTAADSD